MGEPNIIPATTQGWVDLLREKDGVQKFNEIRKRESQPYLTLADVDLSGMDLSGIHLQNVVFQNANLEGTKFNNAKIFSGVKFKGGSLKSATFRNAKVLQTVRHADTFVDGADLENTDFTNSHLEGARFQNVSTLRRAKFNGASLYNTTFDHRSNERIDGEGADFSQANLCNAQFYHADFSHADFNKTACSEDGYEGKDTLWESNRFHNCAFKHTRFTDSRALKNSSIIACALEDVDFQRADLESARFSTGGDIWYANREHLKKEEFKPSRIHGANFTGATLSGARFFFCDLTDVIFKKVNTHFASTKKKDDTIEPNHFHLATLKNVDCSDALLPGARFNDATLNGVNFSGTQLPNASFEGATLQNITVDKKTNFEGARWNEQHKQAIEAFQEAGAKFKGGDARGRKGQPDNTAVEVSRHDGRVEAPAGRAKA